VCVCVCVCGGGGGGLIIISHRGCAAAAEAQTRGCNVGASQSNTMTRLDGARDGAAAASVHIYDLRAAAGMRGVCGQVLVKFEAHTKGLRHHGDVTLHCEGGGGDHGPQPGDSGAAPRYGSWRTSEPPPRRGFADAQVGPDAYSFSVHPDVFDNFPAHSCDPTMVPKARARDDAGAQHVPTRAARQVLLDKSVKFRAARDIPAGSVLSFDYEETVRLLRGLRSASFTEWRAGRGARCVPRVAQEWDLVAHDVDFECACGAPSCKGHIVGKKYRTAAGAADGAAGGGAGAVAAAVSAHST
jgi:hypothetical protein